MRGLIKNELLKLSRKSKLYIVIGFLVLATIIQCYAQYSDITAKSPEKIIAENERLIESMESMVVVQEGGSGGEDGEGEENGVGIANWISDTIEKAKKDIEYAQKKLDNMERDWRVNVAEEIDYREKQKDEAIAKGDIAKQENINAIIKVLNYHLDHDMKPDEEHVMKNTIIINIITYLGSIFLAIVIMMLTVDTIAVENSPATIKLLLTKPVSRGKIYISKFLASLIASLGIIFSIEILTYLIVGIFFGFGNMQTPATIGPKYMPDPIQIARYGMGVKPILESTILVPLWYKLAIILALQIAFIITIVSFGIFISAIMKNGISSIIFGLLSTAILTVITVQISDLGSIKIISTILPYLFSTYSASGLILEGYLSSSLNSTLISVPFAVLVMILWAGLFFLSGYRLFTKRDILA